jgi:hypothetical protein
MFFPIVDWSFARLISAHQRAPDMAGGRSLRRLVWRSDLQDPPNKVSSMNFEVTHEISKIVVCYDLYAC